MASLPVYDHPLFREHEHPRGTFDLPSSDVVAAAHARATGLADRVAVLDWDVHPGNGSQAMFYDRPDVLVVSLHADYGTWDPETHPQTCRPDEHGTGDGEGYTVNVTLPYLTLGALEGALGVDAGVEDPFLLLDEYDPAAREWLADVRAHHEQFWPV